MNKHNEAQEIIKNLEGTLIADLNSLIYWTKELKNTPHDNNLGRLNFTLALVSLIACETLGFYMLGAYKDYEKTVNQNNVNVGVYIMEWIKKYFPKTVNQNNANVGVYIIEWIKKYFPQKNPLKKLNTVLADFLRHALVHGFGSYSPKVSYDIGLFIDIDIKNEIKATTENGKKIIYINSIALAERTIEAFYKFKKEVDDNKNTELIENILKAKNLDRTLNTGVLNQFNEAYKFAEKHGMKL